MFISFFVLVFMLLFIVYKLAFLSYDLLFSSKELALHINFHAVGHTLVISLDSVPKSWSDPQHGCQADAWTLCIWAHCCALRILCGREECYAVTLNLLLSSTHTSPQLRGLSCLASFAHFDACHLIKETETWALSNLSASLHPSPLVLPLQLLMRPPAMYFLISVVRPFLIEEV